VTSIKATSPKKWILHTFLSTAIISIAVVGSAWASLPFDTGWNEVSSVRLEVEFPGDGYHASWTVHRCECGDLLVQSELTAPGEVQVGELLLVGRRAVLSRGFGSEEMESEMSWDAPALMMQLALRLLERSAPAGPARVSEKTIISVEESDQAIQLDSGNAVGGFPAPWAVEGAVEPLSDTRRRFDLNFNFSTGVMVNGQYERSSMRLTGVAEYAESDFPLAGEMPLSDWILNWREADDPAGQSVEEIQFLSELRERIEAN
jgi:hypothetical protein